MHSLPRKRLTTRTRLVCAILATTDPRLDKKRIEREKGGLLEDAYRWVLDNPEFQQWRDGQDRLLWIKGDPGKGETMLLCGIIDELTKSPASVSFFFCQAHDARINTAVAVLRGLIYQLVSQQRSLVSYLRKNYDIVGKSFSRGRLRGTPCQRSLPICSQIPSRRVPT